MRRKRRVLWAQHSYSGVPAVVLLEQLLAVAKVVGSSPFKLSMYLDPIQYGDLSDDVD